MLTESLTIQDFAIENVKIIRINKNSFIKINEYDEAISIVTMIEEHLIRFDVIYRTKESKIIIRSRKSEENIEKIKEEIIQKIILTLEESPKLRLLLLTDVVKINIITEK